MVITLENVLELAQSGNVYSDTPLCTEDGKFRMLKEDVTFRLHDGRLLECKKGMIWDENSVPWFLQWLFPKSGIYAAPALPHDALYYDTSTSQEFADNYYKLLLEAVKASSFQIKWRYRGVVRFGKKWWKRNKENPRARTLHNRELIRIYSKDNKSKEKCFMQSASG